MSKGTHSLRSITTQQVARCCSVTVRVGVRGGFGGLGVESKGLGPAWFFFVCRPLCCWRMVPGP